MEPVDLYNVDESLVAESAKHKDTGLTVGSSTNSQSMTLAAPANAPGM